MDEQKQNASDKGGGLRLNKGKTRLELLHPHAIEGLARVMTEGANKYDERNWEKGMNWSTVLASLKRHLLAFEKGEDYDPETGELHIDHLQANAHFISAYYKIFPHGDNRPINALSNFKIGLDIDEVLCDWIGGWCEKYGYTIPESWHFSYSNKEHFDSLIESGELEEFYMNLNAKVKPNELNFEPECYITSRSIDTEITKRWLLKNGFPARPVITLGYGVSKVQACKDAGLDIFVDDNYRNFKELTDAGIFCYLMDAKHNKRYSVGHRRLMNLSDLR